MRISDWSSDVCSSDLTPWWPRLARSGKATPKVIARLPFAALDGGRGDSPQAVVVSLAEPEESGEDHGYLIVELDEAVSRGALKTLLSDAGFEVCDIQAWVDSPDRTLPLVEVDGFLAADDKHIARTGEARVGNERVHTGGTQCDLT